MSTQLIKTFIIEAIKSKKITAGSSYMKKERVREQLQGLLQDAINSGEVQSQEELEEWWNTIDMAKNALKMVPFVAWKR